MKTIVKPLVFSAFTLTLLAGAAMSTIVVPQKPTPAAVGIDVAVSAVAASTTAAAGTNPPVPSKAFAIWNPGSTSAGVPAGYIAIAVNTTSCNVQSTNTAPNALADWYAPWDPEAGATDNSRKHPYINTNAYRLNSEGRLEQLAASWSKHGWYAASSTQGVINNASVGQDACGSGSCPAGSPANNQLGANCSDTYTSGHNSDTYYLGPRTEISARGTPTAPGWQIRGSYLDNNTSTGSGATLTDAPAAAASQNDGARSYTFSGTAQSYKLCEVATADIVPAALGVNGRFYLEAYYVVNGDANKLNNVAWRAFSSTVPASGTVNTSHLNFASRHTYGPVILQWGDQQSLATPSDEGSIYVASRVVDNNDGTFRYEYNVYNLDLDREIKRVDLAIGGGDVSAMNFRQPRQTVPGYDRSNWTGQYDAVGKGLSFAAPIPGAGQAANGIRWGTMYTMWYTSNYPPRSNGTMTLTQSLAGTSGPLTATASVPRSPADIVAVGGVPGADGLVTGDDFLAFINAFAADDATVADIAKVGGLPGTDGLVTGDDFILFINAFAAG